ncbi:MAG: DotG/IcmE/VirB10 family protein [Deltaproteobacteria bacterium]|nr:DotG/IcmE/VirB10 family protein [Deltaproteobacteria bacterium]
MTLAAPPERQRAAGEAPPATPAAPGLPAGLGPGSVLYAVTDLALDSDLPSPVVATVAEGPLKGAKALGSFRLSGEGLAIAFTRIVPPGGPEIRVEAVGIDPDASRPSVRASVDTHFWERWGSLAAASFIEGLGRAAEGRRTRVYVSGDAVVEDGAGKTARDLALEAAGKVGERAAVQVERGFDRPPTVTVRAGEHVGILLLSVG